MERAGKGGTYGMLLAAAACFLAAGAAIPKLALRDAVPLAREEKNCAYGMFRHAAQESLFDRIALMLGKGIVTKRNGPADFEGKAYTLFALPLGFLHGRPEERYAVSCLLVAPPQGAAASSSFLLADGASYPAFGTFRDAAAAEGVKAFSFDAAGISFRYPAAYALFENNASKDGLEAYGLALLSEAAVREMLAHPVASEGPPGMHLMFFHEPELAVANIVPRDYLKRWLREHPQSNFALSDAGDGGSFREREVAGALALGYRVSGLYESEYAAFVHGEWVILAIADEPAASSGDFDALLASLSFSE